MLEHTLDYRDIPKGKMYFVGGGREFACFRGIDPDMPVTAEEMIEKTGLDWQVEKRNALYSRTDGAIAQVPGRMVTVRTDTEAALGVVGSGYSPLQNRDCFAFADTLVQTGAAGWIGASETWGGARVQAIMRLNRDIKIGGMEDERFLPLLSFRNGHDGGQAVTISIAPFRGACLNGMMLPVKGMMRSWSQRHSRDQEAMMNAAREALDLSWAYYDELEKESAQLVAARMSKQQFTRFLNRLMPLDPEVEPDSRTARNREQALAAVRYIYEQSENLGNVRGTRWAALQAVGEWNDWGRRVRGSDEEAQSRMRLERATSTSAILDRAYELLT